MLINKFRYFLHGMTNGTNHKASRHFILVDFWEQIKLIRYTPGLAAPISSLTYIFSRVSAIRAEKSSVGTVMFSLSCLLASTCLSRTCRHGALSTFLMTMLSLFFSLCKADLSSIVRLWGTAFKFVRGFCLIQQHQCKTQVLYICPVPVPKYFWVGTT